MQMISLVTFLIEVKKQRGPYLVKKGILLNAVLFRLT
jgi:hypothetical protein